VRPDAFNSLLGPLFSESDLHTPTDFFARILAFTATQHFEARRDLSQVLGPAFKRIHTPLAAFIDNVDEHFDTHLSPPSRGMGSPGATDKRLWYSAQIGLAVALRDLHLQNHHVKIYTSIRSEAFSELVAESAVSQQLEGSAVRLQYETEDLRTIFSRNLSAEPNENCVAPKEPDPFDRFFGPDSRVMTHPHVNEKEDLWRYILRHTLGRPRDLMTVGAKLSRLAPTSRDYRSIRRTINEASTEIAASYLLEVAPHMSVPVPFDDLFRLIPRNIMTREEIEQIANNLWTGSGLSRAGDERPHYFCNLYKAGLLGHITLRVGTLEQMQSFERPGDLLFVADGCLPKSKYYVVHPALDARIRKSAPNYGFDTFNVAGSNRPWRDAGQSRGIVQGDVVGYSTVMANPDLCNAFPGDFDEIVRAGSGGLRAFKIEKGDTFVLEDRNALNLLKAVRLIASLLKERYGLEIRAGGDFGVVVETGSAYRTSARLEAVTIANTLAVTRAFVDRAKAIAPETEFRPVIELDAFTPMKAMHQFYDIRKSAADPETLRELYYLYLV